MAAAGSVQRWRGSGLGQLTDDHLHTHELSTGTDRLRGVPFLVGGSAFAPVPGRCGAWRGWPDAVLWVPRWVVVRNDTGRLAVSHVIAVPADSPAALARRMADERRRLVGWVVGQGSDSDSSGRAHRLLSDQADAMPVEESAPSWCARVGAARQAIRDDFEGGLDKVVLARAAIERPEPGCRWTPLGTMRALRQRNPQAFTFLIHNERGGVLVGATPELLARKQGKRLETEALAGTAARGASPERDTDLAAGLLASAKERYEHAIVVERIVDALRSIGGTVARDAVPHVTRLPHVHHLKTRITASLPGDVGLVDAIGALHPTPAVGGSPYAAASLWLRNHEALDRGWYGAPVGWLDAGGNGVFAVAIRSALMTADSALLFAGAGIVCDSDPKREWIETELKLGVIRDALRSEPEGDA